MAAAHERSGPLQCQGGVCRCGAEIERTVLVLGHTTCRTRHALSLHGARGGAVWTAGDRDVYVAKCARHRMMLSECFCATILVSPTFSRLYIHCLHAASSNRSPDRAAFRADQSCIYRPWGYATLALARRCVARACATQRRDANAQGRVCALLLPAIVRPQLLIAHAPPCLADSGHHRGVRQV